MTRLKLFLRAFFSTSFGRNVGHFGAAAVGAFLASWALIPSATITISALIALVPGALSVAFRQVFPHLPVPVISAPAVTTEPAPVVTTEPAPVVTTEPAPVVTAPAVTTDPAPKA